MTSDLSWFVVVFSHSEKSKSVCNGRRMQITSRQSRAMELYAVVSSVAVFEPAVRTRKIASLCFWLPLDPQRGFFAALAIFARGKKEKPRPPRNGWRIFKWVLPHSCPFFVYLHWFQRIGPVHTFMARPVLLVQAKSNSYSIAASTHAAEPA